MISRLTPVLFTQETPLAEWVINHKLGNITNVSVVIELDGKWVSILPSNIEHRDNQTVISFKVPRAGKARLS